MIVLDTHALLWWTFEPKKMGKKAARWVWQSQDFGAHRLGHALAAAVHPDICKERAFKETATERTDHLTWLLQEEQRLGHYGYSFNTQEVRAELSGLASGTYVSGSYDQETLTDAYHLQEAVLEYLADQQAIVEVCPTSNFRIGQIEEVEHHSLPRFQDAGVNLVVASDDPGVFGITLNDEAELCREIFGLKQSDLQAIDDLAAASKASILARREP